MWPAGVHMQDQNRRGKKLITIRKCGGLNHCLHGLILHVPLLVQDFGSALGLCNMSCGGAVSEVTFTNSQATFLNKFKNTQVTLSLPRGD